MFNEDRVEADKKWFSQRTTRAFHVDGLVDLVKSLASGLQSPGSDLGFTSC